MSDSNDGMLVLLALGVVAALIIIFKRQRGRHYPTGPLPYFSKQALLSKGELAFFHVLRSALPPTLHIAPKVRVSDVIGCSHAAWKTGFGSRISQKHIDFVIIDVRTAEFIVVVELDDKSHRQRERAERDKFLDRAFAAAGVRTLRVPAAARYEVVQIRTMVMG